MTVTLLTTHQTQASVPQSSYFIVAKYDVAQYATMQIHGELKMLYPSIKQKRLHELSLATLTSTCALRVYRVVCLEHMQSNAALMRTQQHQARLECGWEK